MKKIKFVYEYNIIVHRQEFYTIQRTKYKLTEKKKLFSSKVIIHKKAIETQNYGKYNNHLWLFDMWEYVYKFENMVDAHNQVKKIIANEKEPLEYDPTIKYDLENGKWTPNIY